MPYASRRRDLGRRVRYGPRRSSWEDLLLLDGLQHAIRDYRGYALYELQEQGAVVGDKKKVEGSERQYGADEFQRFLRV